MKPLVILTTVMFVSLSCGIAQNQLSIQGTKVPNDKIYLTFEAGKLRYFLDPQNEAGSKPMAKTGKFALQNNDCNIFVRWLNPLRYELQWSDSTFDDERDVMMKDFIANLTQAFGTPVTNLNKDKKESKTLLERSGITTRVAGGLMDLPQGGFHSFELTTLYLMLRRPVVALTPQEVTALDNILKELIEIDEKNATNIGKIADSVFVELFKIETAQSLTTKLPAMKTGVANIEGHIFSEIESNVQSTSRMLATLDLADNVLEGYTKNVVSAFFTQVVANLAANRQLIKKFEPVINVMASSLKFPGDVPKPGEPTEYHRQREISIGDGKALSTGLTLIEKEYDATKHEFKVKSKDQTGTLQFRKYDAIGVFMSAGGFYGNTSLDGFGVDKDLKVTEDNIDKNTFVSAVFLNFSFGPSRYLSPLVQLGIDPTKKRPFMLLGSGIVIPAARFAIAAGGIWTWQPILSKLAIGQTLTSTTELEKDISFKFDMAPRGWYLGIQYNF